MPLSPTAIRLAVAVATLFATTLSYAQDTPKTSQESAFRMRGHAELDFASEHNFNLDRTEHEDFTILEPELRLRLGYVPHPFIQLIGQMRLRRKLDLHYEDREKDRDWALELEELYFASVSRSTEYRLFLGRTEFKDSREWLYDMNLDGVRVFFAVPGVRIDASLTRLNFYSDDLFAERVDEPIANAHVYAAYALPNDGFAAAYWFMQDDRRTHDEQIHYIGLRSGGEPRKGFVYWAELMHVLGDFEEQKLSSTGFDVGFHYEFKGKLRPYPILGYAFGTGDNSPDDGTNQNFRQTGYQDNNGRFGGVARYKYYGELFEPDLSNMGIATAGMGIRPWKRTSFDVVYHHYKQHYASDEILRTNIDADPDGMHTYLGEEINFVIGFREIKNLRAEAIAAWFFPGSAFDPSADYAFYSGIEFRYLY